MWQSEMIKWLEKIRELLLLLSLSTWIPLA